LTRRLGFDPLFDEPGPPPGLATPSVTGVLAAMVGGTVTMTGGLQAGLRGRSSLPVRLPPTETGLAMMPPGLPMMPILLMRPPAEGVAAFAALKPPTGPTAPRPPRCAASAAVTKAKTVANATSAKHKRASEFGFG